MLRKAIAATLCFSSTIVYSPQAGSAATPILGSAIAPSGG